MLKSVRWVVSLRYVALNIKGCFDTGHVLIILYVPPNVALAQLDLSSRAMPSYAGRFCCTLFRSACCARTLARPHHSPARDIPNVPMPWCAATIPGCIGDSIHHGGQCMAGEICNVHHVYLSRPSRYRLICAHIEFLIM
jgi:hypothetical protein